MLKAFLRAFLSRSCIPHPKIRVLKKVYEKQQNIPQKRTINTVLFRVSFLSRFQRLRKREKIRTICLFAQKTFITEIFSIICSFVSSY